MSNASFLNDMLERIHLTLRSKSGSLMLATGLAIILATLLLPVVDSLRPNFYQPARPALTRAKLHLSAFYDDEKSLLLELSQAHMQLMTTLTLLSEAKSQLTPDERVLVEQVRSRLTRLEDERATKQMTSRELRRTYRDLATQLETVIHRTE